MQRCSITTLERDGPLPGLRSEAFVFRAARGASFKLAKGFALDDPHGSDLESPKRQRG